MTHDELLAKVEKQTIHIANKIKPVANDCEKEIGGFANALRAVVELCNFLDQKGRCCVPVQEIIQAIEKELG